MGHTLDDIFTGGSYHFFYIALVGDVNYKAQARINEFDMAGWPTAFFDGGDEVVVGGYSDWPTYTGRITTCGNRSVNDIDVTLDMTWLGNDEIQIDFSITNHEMFNDEPYDPAFPPDMMTDGCINIEYDFEAVVEDPEGDSIFYRYYFDDGVLTDWLGPYASGEPCPISHAWASAGDYEIRVVAKDIYDQQSNWIIADAITIHEFVAGDANSDLIVNLMDVIYLINFVYKGGPMPDPYASGDLNGNGVVNIMDIVYGIAFLYQGGPPPVYGQ